MEQPPIHSIRQRRRRSYGLRERLQHEYGRRVGQDGRHRTVEVREESVRVARCCAYLLPAAIDTGQAA